MAPEKALERKDAAVTAATADQGEKKEPIHNKNDHNDSENQPGAVVPASNDTGASAEVNDTKQVVSKDS